MSTAISALAPFIAQVSEVKIQREHRRSASTRAEGLASLQLEAKSCQTPTSDPISKAYVQGECVITYDRKGIEGCQIVIDDFI